MNSVGDEFPEKPLVEPLTRRELDILDLLAEGLTGKEMAGRLTLAVSSVRWYVQQIYGKLGVKGKRQAINRACELGLIKAASDRLISPAEFNQTVPRPKQSSPTGNSLPTGTVTFLFTDIQGSTPLWERESEKMAVALQIHNTALQRVIEAQGGTIFKFIGDEYQAAFPTASQALQAAINGQKALHAALWNELGELKVRMGLHTGEVELDPSGGEYTVSHVKNRVGRIRSAAHGGQVLLSQESADLVRRNLPTGVTLKDLGEHRLRGMAIPERLFQVCIPGLLQEFPPLATAIASPNNLPIQISSFIGREKEVREVTDLLGKFRLVTLTGPGGVGKTRLAVEIACRLLPDFPQGAWLIELAPVSSPGLTLQAVATVFCVREEPDHPLEVALTDYMREKKLLLVLDNCEHLIETCADLAAHWLRLCPGLQILASSREALGIEGEAAYLVPSLSLPSTGSPDLVVIGQSEAIQLFLDRAAASMGSYSLTQANAASVAQICRRLDGIPLAIELAAGRVKLLNVEQIVTRLDKVFQLLTGGTRTALPRQQTLRATIDWSYNLLSDTERLFLRYLSVFAGKWTLEAAEAVCAVGAINSGAVLDYLSSLVNKSLVMVEHQPGKEACYRLLETIRHYGREKLLEAGESESAYRQHLAYFLHVAEQAEPMLDSAEQLDWYDRLDEEHDNLLAALDWALESDPEAGLRLAGALGRYWYTRMHREGIVRLERALEAGAGSPAEVRAKALWKLTWPLVVMRADRNRIAALCQESITLFAELGDKTGLGFGYNSMYHWESLYGDKERAKAWAERALAMFQEAGHDFGATWALLDLGLACMDIRDYEHAEEHLQQALAILRRIGVSMFIAWALCLLGDLAFAQGSYRRALSFSEEGLPLFRRFNNTVGLFHALETIGNAWMMLDDYEQAFSAFEECLNVSREMGLIWQMASSMMNMGSVLLLQGDVQQALAYYHESLRLAQESSDEKMIAKSIVTIANIAGIQGRYENAARLFGAAERRLPAIMEEFLPPQQADLECTFSLIRTYMGEEAYQKARAGGQALPTEQAVLYALET